MKRMITYSQYVALAVGLATLPVLLADDCVPSGATGDTVSFTLVTLKNTQVASYATGTLTITNNNIPYSVEQGRTLSATKIPQLLSNQTASYAPGCTSSICLDQTTQPFNAFQPDQLGVSVSESTNLLAIGGAKSGITITLTLESKGNEQLSFAGTCASTGELYGTYESNSFAVIAFGTPEPPQTSPQPK